MLDRRTFLFARQESVQIQYVNLAPLQVALDGPNLKLLVKTESEENLFVSAIL